jgi:hypothetical protein
MSNAGKLNIHELAILFRSANVFTITFHQARLGTWCKYKVERNKDVKYLLHRCNEMLNQGNAI